MKILIDSRILEGTLRGMGYVLKSIIEQISMLDNKNSYILLVREKSKVNALKVGNNFSYYSSNFPFGIADIITIPYIVNKKINPDLVWFPANNCSPFINKKIKIISSILDIIYFYHKYKLFSWQWFGSKYRQLFSTVASRRADLIHTISILNIKLISSFFKISEKRFFYTYPGLNVSAEYDDSILLKYIIAPKLYIYTISGSSPHKNLAVLIRAFNLFLQKRKDTEIKLVVSGVPNPLEYLQANKLESENIIFTDYVSNQGKNSLLRNCRIFMFLSKEEGFGMPPAEAAFNFCNILLSDIPILRELYSDCAHFTSLDDINIISDDMNKYWDFAPDYNKDLCISKFNWNLDARIMLSKFNELIKE